MSHDYVILMIKLELIIVNVLQFTNMAAPRGLVKTVIPVSLKPKRIQTLEYAFSIQETILRPHAKNQPNRPGTVSGRSSNFTHNLLDCPRVTLIIHIVRHIDQRVRVKGNLFAPKCSYANIPYVQCSETLIISGCCVFLLPLPFELKFWFFEFEYVT